MEFCELGTVQEVALGLADRAELDETAPLAFTEVGSMSSNLVTERRSTHGHAATGQHCIHSALGDQVSACFGEVVQGAQLPDILCCNTRLPFDSIIGHTLVLFI